MQDLSSLTRNRTRVSGFTRGILNQWTTREVPLLFLIPNPRCATVGDGKPPPGCVWMKVGLGKPGAWVSSFPSRVVEKHEQRLQTKSSDTGGAEAGHLQTAEAGSQLPQWLRGRQSACSKGESSRRRRGFDPWVREIPWRRAWQPTPVSLPGGSQGRRSLAGSSPWFCRIEHDRSD